MVSPIGARSYFENSTEVRGAIILGALRVVKTPKAAGLAAGELLGRMRAGCRGLLSSAGSGMPGGCAGDVHFGWKRRHVGEGG